jgi:hypothetical protein
VIAQCSKRVTGQYRLWFSHAWDPCPLFLVLWHWVKHSASFSIGFLIRKIIIILYDCLYLEILQLWCPIGSTRLFQSEAQHKVKLWNSIAWVWIPPTLLTSFVVLCKLFVLVVLGKLFVLSKLKCPCLSLWNVNCINLIILSWRLSEMLMHNHFFSKIMQWSDTKFITKADILLTW